MADVWKHLFDTEWRQRNDLEATREAVDDTRLDLNTMRSELDRARSRVDRLELVLHGLLASLDRAPGPPSAAWPAGARSTRRCS